MKRPTLFVSYTAFIMSNSTNVSCLQECIRDHIKHSPLNVTNNLESHGDGLEKSIRSEIVLGFL